MSPKLKSILLVILFSFTVIGLGTALYFAFFRGVVTEPAPEDPTVTEQPGSGEFPSAGEGAPGIFVPGGDGAGLQLADEVARGGQTQTTELTDTPVENLGLSPAGLNYYNEADGKFYRVDENGNTVALSEARFPEAESVEWSGTGDKAVIEFPDGSNIVYDFATKKQVTLPRHWEDFEFSPENDEILAKSVAIDPANRWLIVSNGDGSNVKAVQALGENANRVQVSWSPNDQVIAFANNGTPLEGGFDRQLILPVGKNHENYEGLVVEGLGFIPNWAPDGRKLLYSASGASSGERPLLWVVDATPSSMGDNRQSLGLNTWADKCTFSSNTTAICAVPQNLPANAGLQRALYEDLPDSLYQLDLRTGRSSLLAIPATPTTMNNLSISANGSNVFYQNGLTGRAETIRLR